MIQATIHETPSRLQETSSMLIESALKQTSNHNQINKPNFTNFSQLEQIESADETIQQYHHHTIPDNQTKQTNLFSEISAARNSNDSLVSFEHHELTQLTPMSRVAASPAIVFDSKAITKNSTPFIQPEFIKPISGNNNQRRSGSPESVEGYKDNFKKFLDNLNTSDLHMYGGDIGESKVEELTAMSIDQSYTISIPGNRRNNDENDDLVSP